ncbi:MAG: DUF58 domain-containing protein [Planctomycetota bacterium]|nr:DUF58 domain-containing protein [Planctomycetota bacterium]
MESTNKRKPEKLSGNQARGWIGRIGGILNYDFCPWANWYVYWLKQPVGWVVCGIFASLLVGLMIGPQGFILMWAFTGLLALGAIWPLLAIKGISCQLSFTKSRSGEGELTKAVLEVTNHWPLPIFGLMIVGDFLQDILEENDEIAIGLQRIPPRCVSTFKWSIHPEKRGLLPVDQPVIKNGFPFGFYHAVKQVAVSGRTIIWPRNLDLNGVPEVAGNQFNISGIMSDRAGVDGDMIGVREYRQGDSLRHIHWAKTAQRDRLIVQERQSFASCPFDVYLDLNPSAHAGQASQSSYEWAIRIAGSICRQLHLHHAQLSLHCLGLPVETASRVGNQNGLTPVLDFLAMLPSLDDLKLNGTAAPSRAVTHEGGRKTVIIATSQSRDFPTNSEIHQVVIDTRRFEHGTGEHQPTDLTPTTSPMPPSRQRVEVTHPLTVENELATGWEKGICNGT